MSEIGVRGSVRGVAVLAALIALVLAGVAAFRAGPPPSIAIEAALPGIGKRTPVRVQIDEASRGIGDVRVELLQGERVELLAAHSYAPRASWQFWGGRQQTDVFELEVGSETIQGLEEGPAKIRVIADRAGAWLRFPAPVSQELELTVKLRPPSLHVLSTHIYVAQGGSEAVVYQVGASSVRDGVQAGDWFFPGYPLPGGGDRQRFTIFGAPYDLEDVDRIRLVAVDDVGNEAQASFVDRFSRRPLQTGRIQLSDSFLARVVPAILAQATGVEDQGGLLENYLEINGELRRRNNDTLTELTRKSEPEFLWRGRFLQMRNAKVMSDFAVRRTYYYNDQPVDAQDHLGFDLASVRQAEIQAANSGVVVLASYFGIYGNAVAIDHGFGLTSLYGHLSSIAVEDGQTVERGQVIGRSGATGLAGGDHLHFTMLLHGLPVDPREWWDGHWIQDRLALKLGAALPSS